MKHEDVISSLNLTTEQIFNQTLRESKIGSFVYRCDTESGWWSDEMYHLLNVKKSVPISINTHIAAVEQADKSKVRDLFHHITNKKYFDIVYRVRGQGDKIHWLRQKGTLYEGEKEAAPYIAGSLFDITKLKEEQAEIQTNQEEAEARTLELEKSVALEKLKSEFFANLSHEFKTPLNIIISSLDLIKLKLSKQNQQMYEQEYMKFIGYAYHNCYKLLRLTTNLLDSTKIDNQFLKAQFNRCKLVQLLEEITKSAEIYADARGIKLSFYSEVEADVQICCDIDQVDRILLNLISNSIKNTPVGGEINVKFTENSEFYEVTVQDTGVGISEDVLPQIFNRFQFTNKGPMANHDGSGIGLSIVKSLVEMHGGKIQVISEIGYGSRFVFTIAKNLMPDERLQAQFPNGMSYDYEARQSRVKMELSNLG